MLFQMIRKAKRLEHKYNVLEKIICYALSIFTCCFSFNKFNVSCIFSTYHMGPHTHFQFIIQAEGQNCHGGLVLALTLQLKTAV